MPSVKEIQKLPPKTRIYLGDNLVFIADGPCRGRFVYRYTSPITHRVTETTIGEWPTYGYSSARQVATQLRVMVLTGLDPVQEARKREASRKTFAEVCDDWVKTQISEWSPGQIRNVDLCLKKGAAKSLATKSISHIDNNMVEDVIRPIWNKSPRQGRRVLGMLAQVFAYAKHKKIYAGDNPAVWKGNMEFVFKMPNDVDEKHHDAMAYALVPKFIRDLRSRQSNSTSAVALEFLILTGPMRTNEVLGAQWDEIDFENRVWTIPAQRMKKRKQHRVPLSDRAMELLKWQKNCSTGSFVFTGYDRNSRLSENSMLAFLRDMGIKNDTIAGFRSSFRDWGAEKTDFDFFVLEICLAHAVGNKVTRAYMRGDAIEKRRVVMKTWADYLDSHSANINKEAA
jgi:integrase